MNNLIHHYFAMGLCDLLQLLYSLFAILTLAKSYYRE